MVVAVAITAIYFICLSAYLYIIGLSLLVSFIVLISPLIIMAIISIVENLRNRMCKNRLIKEKEELVESINKDLLNTDYYVDKESYFLDFFEVYRKEDDSLFLRTSIDTSSNIVQRKKKISKQIKLCIDNHGDGKVLFSEIIKSIKFEDILLVYIFESEHIKWNNNLYDRNAQSLEELKIDVEKFKEIFLKLKTCDFIDEGKDMKNYDSHYYSFKIEGDMDFDINNPKDFYYRSSNLEYRDNYLKICLEFINKLMEK